MHIHRLFVIVALLLPLSLDTFVVAAALGVAGLPKKNRMRTSLILAIFEAGMPAIGFLIGATVSSAIGRFSVYIAAIVIGLAGGMLVLPAKDREHKQLKLLAQARGLGVIGLGISISIDELAIGLSLGLLHAPLLAVVVYLGIQAFTAAQLGLWLGHKLSAGSRENAEKIAGSILVLLALGMLALKAGGHVL